MKKQDIGSPPQVQQQDAQPGRNFWLCVDKSLTAGLSVKISLEGVAEDNNPVPAIVESSRTIIGLFDVVKKQHQVHDALPIAEGVVAESEKCEEEHKEKEAAPADEKPVKTAAKKKTTKKKAKTKTSGAAPKKEEEGEKGSAEPKAPAPDSSEQALANLRKAILMPAINEAEGGTELLERAQKGDQAAAQETIETIYRPYLIDKFVVEWESFRRMDADQLTKLAAMVK